MPYIYTKIILTGRGFSELIYKLYEYKIVTKTTDLNYDGYDSKCKAAQSWVKSFHDRA